MYLADFTIGSMWTLQLEVAAEREPGRPPHTAVGRFIRTKGADFFAHAHHALYQRTEDVSVPTAEPRALVAHFSGDPVQRQAAASPEAMTRVRALLRPLLFA